MAFKDIVVVLRGFPTPTPTAAVDDAVELAALLGARLSGIACATTPRVPRSILGDALINVSGLVAAESHKIAVSAQAALTTFQGAAAKRGVLGQHILHKCQTSEVAGALADYARLRDLAILPMPEGDYLQQFDSQWYAETIIFESGHPTIVLPYDRKGGRPITLNTVVVAWDNSRAAARAVADALPILRQAKITRVVTVTNEKAILRGTIGGGALATPGATWRQRRPRQCRCRGPRNRAGPQRLRVILYRRSDGDGGLRPFPLSRIHPGWGDQEHAHAPSDAGFSVTLSDRTFTAAVSPASRAAARKDQVRSIGEQKWIC